MSDFNIDVGFNTKGFENMFGKQGGAGPDAGVKKGGNGEAGGMGAVGKGLFTALKATGIVALLMNLKVIVDLLGGILAIMNLGVILFLKAIYEFFQDPARGLLNFGLFIVNGFIGAIESLANFLKPGKDLQLGRFRSDVVGEELDAGAGLLEALQKGFLTENEYFGRKAKLALEAQEKEREAYALQFEADRARAELAKNYAENVSATLDPALTEGSNAFIKFWNNFIKESNKMNKAVTGRSLSGIKFATQLKGGALSPGEEYDAGRLQSGTTGDKEARAINYLTGFGR